MSKCNCYFCVKYRELTRAKHDKDFQAMTNLAEELGDRAISAEFELDYHACILDGEWPSAVQILEKALEKAKNKELERLRNFVE